jgi:predicted kinase
MSKQLIFVLGPPFSGKTTWVKKNLLGPNIEQNSCIEYIDATNFDSLYVNSKISEESIEASRKWCLDLVEQTMGSQIDEIEKTDKTNAKIVVCMIASRPDKWREFLQLAINYEYEISFKFPSNKLFQK